MSMFDMQVEISESSAESGVDLTIESDPLDPRKLAASSTAKEEVKSSCIWL